MLCVPFCGLSIISGEVFFYVLIDWYLNWYLSESLEFILKHLGHTCTTCTLTKRFLLAILVRKCILALHATLYGIVKCSKKHQNGCQINIFPPYDCSGIIHLIISVLPCIIFNQYSH